SERPAELSGLNAGLAHYRPDGGPAPIALDVSGAWPEGPFDAAFSANTAHIMHWREVVAMLSGVARCLRGDGLFILYGPFKRAGRHHAGSNAEFDASLQARDPGMGIRDLNDLEREAESLGLERIAELCMPANNHILVFCKKAAREQTRPLQTGQS
ncbi:MAG: class I SAM-dependent methyltransferase, partial [Xanthomonadaceae bacterium]|nr:class I SAM-dependent methyltransferase [Xanthomonadaceae bacterium]